MAEPRGSPYPPGRAVKRVNTGLRQENEQVRKVFRTLFITTAGLVLVQVVDLATAEQIVGIITRLVP